MNDPVPKKRKIDGEGEGVDDQPQLIPSSMSSDSLLKEENVGITEYISQTPPFFGIIKQRYSDFLVNEIDVNGKVITLQTRDIIEKNEKKQEKKELDNGNQELQSKALSLEDIDLLKTLMESQDKKKIVTLSVDAGDKENRTIVHQEIRKLFPSLESSTKELDGKKVIQVSKYNKRSNRPSAWPASQPDYTQFVLYKEAKDTIEAIYKLANFLKIKKDRFHFAGTKDKRGKTTQLVTAYRVEAEHLVNVGKSLWGMAVGNIQYVDKALKLGQLGGNKFTIVLRNVKGEEKVIDEAMSSLRDTGFINYFGMQRFGRTSVPTYQTGIAVIKGNWKEAVETIMKPREGEDDSVKELRQEWWEQRNSGKSLSKFPRKLNTERMILQGLEANGENNYSTAFNTIHRNSRLLYLHSYQSLIWNQVVSHRIKHLGLEPVEGDLAISTQEGVLDPPSDEIEVGDKEDDSKLEEKDDSDGILDHLRLKPTVITKENKGNFTIHDIVLPLPGYAVSLPENECKDLYEQLLAQDGLTMQDMNHKIKQYRLPGGYRHLVVCPSDVSWKLMKYQDKEDLTLSDLDRLNGLPEPCSLEDGKLTALKIEFKLPPSCYATMALREVLKMDTSSHHQATLNTT